MHFINLIQRYTLLLFFFSINFEVLSPFAGNDNFSVSRMTGILYIISILPQIALFIRTDAVKYYLIPLALFFGLFTLMGVLNVNEFYSEYISIPILLNILIFWILINHERKDFLILEKGMISFALGSGVIALFFNLGIGVMYRADRLMMFGDDANYIGSRTSVGILILILAVVQNRLKLGRYRYVLLLPIPFMIKLLFETASRLGFVAFVFSLGAGIFLYKTKNIWGKLKVFAFGIAVLIIVGIILMHSEVMVERLIFTAETEDTGGRAQIWQNLLPIISNNPVFGIGRTGWAYHSYLIYGKLISPHNVFLEVLCYTGIAGLIIYLVFLYRIWMASYISYKKKEILLPLLLLIPIGGMLLTIQILAVKIGWIIFAYIVSSLAIRGKTPLENKRKSLCIFFR